MITVIHVELFQAAFVRDRGRTTAVPGLCLPPSAPRAALLFSFHKLNWASEACS